SQSSAIEPEEHGSLVNDLIVVQVGDRLPKGTDVAAVLVGLLVDLVSLGHGVARPAVGGSGRFAGGTDIGGVFRDVFPGFIQLRADLVGMSGDLIDLRLDRLNILANVFFRGAAHQDRARYQDRDGTNRSLAVHCVVPPVDNSPLGLVDSTGLDAA